MRLREESPTRNLNKIEQCQSLNDIFRCFVVYEYFQTELANCQAHELNLFAWLC